MCHSKSNIYYHAVLNSIGEYLFNQLFQNLYLYSWHTDPDLGIQSIHTDYFLPGDVVYFNNPDVDPKTPWWRGQNVVDLGDGTYFGHGFGIWTGEEMIQILNTKRIPESKNSAYLTNIVTRPTFKDLAKYSMLPRSYTAKKQHIVIHHNKSSISSSQYLFYLNKVYNNMIYLHQYL